MKKTLFRHLFSTAFGALAFLFPTAARADSACTLSSTNVLGAYVAALVVVAFYLTISAIVTGGKFANIITGVDGRTSTSKFQFFLWTAVVLFTYVLIYACRAVCKNYDALDAIPHNVLLAMGFSVVTLAAAKGITVSYKSSGRVDKPPANGTSKGGLFTDDSGNADLTKIQMVVWTLIATVVYLIQVTTRLDTFAHYTNCSAAGASCPFPDIDAVLMVLMGLGQGAYLGNKLTTADSRPMLTTLSKPTARAGESVEITGDGFGDAQRGSQVTLDGTPLATTATTWTPTKIAFTVPAKHPNGTVWAASQTVSVAVIVDGDTSRQQLPLVVTQA